MDGIDRADLLGQGRCQQINHHGYKNLVSSNYNYS